MTPREISQSLTKGSEDQWVTVIEGLRTEQIAKILLEKGYRIDPVKWKNQVEKEVLEGKLFPDSYLIPKEADQEKIIQIFLKNFEKKVVNDLSVELKKSNLNLIEVLILSSLVEREASHDADRAIVAGILLNRLNNSWPLQIDATVQYVVASQQCLSSLNFNCEWWPKTLTQNNLKIDSLYNTYLNEGLPPGPICNPGLSSIKAVLQPEKTNYWFYLSDKSGNMHYAKTSEEHVQNIEKYLR